MREVLRRVTRVALIAMLPAALLVGSAVDARAQQPLASAPTAAEFFPRFDFALAATALSYPDPRFSWDAHWIGDFDFFNYDGGRAQFLADYETLLGSEFQPFDPYQSNYTLEASGSYFVGSTEFAAVLNHISRHLGDRPKFQMVAENSLGVRVMRQVTSGSTTIDLRGDLRKIIEHAYVDYTWMTDLDVRVKQQIAPHIGVFAHVNGQVIPVDPAIAGRTAQYGGRAEAGLRLPGTKGTLELYGGVERVIDADPLDRVTRRWPFVGFRLLRE
ncbi:MAG: hypothetical protein LBQ09_08175 [Acidobacteriaceae bacterium]|jgi:hypothetical protein|nr:hypothetical protein [Acidobacteriaceae bacterium]